MKAPFHAYHEDFGYYEDRARGLLASAQDGTETAARAFSERGADLSETGARQVVAAEHGAGNWEELRAHVAGLRTSGEPFAQAYRAVEARDPERLAQLLDEFPDLVNARGTNGNDLLGMSGATGDERLSILLLARGADPSSANLHGWTALHQAAYSDQPSLAQRLINAGARADISARGDGGTPLVVALFWGHRETAELLAEHGVVPGNLRAAAGLGDPELLSSLFDDDGRPSPAAGAHRGFYRPHSGFPFWTPSDHPREALDEALAWAARSDRLDALSTLAARGAALDADVYRGTALAWAAACGRADAVTRLAELGADPSGRSSFGGLDHGRKLTPLHLAAQAGHLDAVRALLDAGADPTIRDAIYDSGPAGWAEHFGQAQTAELLRDATR